MNWIQKLLTAIGVFCLTITLGSAGYAATISGKALFVGTAPEGEQLDLAADPTCAALHPEGLNSEEVVVNSNGTLKNVFVYIKEGLEGQTFEPPTQPVVLDQQGCRYVPHVFGVQAGQPIAILNSDATLHNVHSVVTENKEFNLGMPIQGMKLKKTFDKPEVMAKFKCDVHPWMSSYAGVLEHSFFSVSSDKGTFEIKDLPLGEYTIEAWHETYGVKSQTVSIGAADEIQNIDFQYEG
jgi:plastocyanin